MTGAAGKLAAAVALTLYAAAAPDGWAADDADLVLAASCGGCHVAADATGGIPGLGDQPPQQLEALLLAYKRDTKHGTLMNRIARGYSDDELRRIAGVLGSAPDR